MRCEYCGSSIGFLQGNCSKCGAPRDEIIEKIERKKQEYKYDAPILEKTEKIKKEQEYCESKCVEQSKGHQYFRDGHFAGTETELRNFTIATVFMFGYLPACAFGYSLYGFSGIISFTIIIIVATLIFIVLKGIISALMK